MCSLSTVTPASYCIYCHIYNTNFDMCAEVIEMLMFSSCNPKFFAVRHIQYPVNPSSYHFHTDAEVPSSDHWRTESVPSSDHYCTDTVAPPSDHCCLDIVVPSSDHCDTETLPPSSYHYCTKRVAPPSDQLYSK